MSVCWNQVYQRLYCVYCTVPCPQQCSTTSNLKTMLKENTLNTLRKEVPYQYSLYSPLLYFSKRILMTDKKGIFPCFDKVCCVQTDLIHYCIPISLSNTTVAVRCIESWHPVSQPPTHIICISFSITTPCSSSTLSSPSSPASSQSSVSQIITVIHLL